MQAVALTGWYVGYAITFVIIVLVVILVATILTLARRIGLQAFEIEKSLEQSRANTEALWELNVVNDGVSDLIGHASAIRQSLEDA